MTYLGIIADKYNTELSNQRYLVYLRIITYKL